MSTIDPDLARREREARIPGGSSLVLPGLAAFVFAGLFAWSLRRMISDATDADDLSGGLIVCLVVLLVSVVAAFIAIGRWGSRTIRNPRLPGWAAPVGLALLGAAVALAVYAPAPALVRAPSLDPLPLGLGIAGVLLLLLAVWARSARVRQQDAEERIVSGAPPVTGTVTNQGYTHFGESERILTVVTYAFVDASGVQRWVQKSEMIDARNPIVEGEQVDLWFDRMNPADTSRIVVRRRGLTAR